MERAELARQIVVAIPPVDAASSRVSPGGRRIIEERAPWLFMAAFAAAVASSDEVFLADPSWGDTERASLAQLMSVSPASNVSSSVDAASSRVSLGNAAHGWLMIPSGGSSGQLKFARHDQDTIATAVAGFCGHFHESRANWVGLLPLHHVSGLMAWMRCALTGGAYLPWDWKRIEAGDLPSLNAPSSVSRSVEAASSRVSHGGLAQSWYLSLVPTQLQRLMDRPGALDWLRGFQAIFVGGGPVWSELAEAAARAGLPVSLSYGMTETAAMASAQRPEEFLQGDRSSGAPLGHVQLAVTAEGMVRVEGESIFRGYFPEWRRERWIRTDDLGAIDPSGRLTIAGRRDDLIITGGEKVDPREVEAALRASGAFADVAVLGVADADWGRAVVAFYPEMDSPPDMDKVAHALAGLAAFKRPRRYVPVGRWPRNAQGKLNRAALLERGAFGGPQCP